ncbi:MAG TPA: amidohydrolase family protein [Candidatus Saccharimonadales bacterium]|nr:amidohydrolase family protein [Candidatus Saccharimonadales bacterium]
MKKLLVVTLLLVLAAGSLLWSCKRPPKINLAITHVTLIDATGSPAQSDMSVVIANQKITAIGPTRSTGIPDDARIVDATGKFLIPGLTDAHIHLTGAGEPGGSREFILPLLVASGITTVRDMGSYLESISPLRKDIQDGKRLGPRIFTPGPYLDGSPPSFQPSFVVTNAVQASEDVHALVERKVDFIKVQSRLARDAYFGIADACRREHIPFVGHVPDAVTASEASDAGQKSIEHLTGVLRACSSNERRLMGLQFVVPAMQETPVQSRDRQFALQNQLLTTYSEEKASQLIAQFVKNQTWQTPTLILLKNDAYPTPQSDPSRDERNKYVPHQLLETWKKGIADRDKRATPQEYELRSKLLQKSLQLVGKMQAAGVRIMAGTDSSAPYIFPGSSLHEELFLLVQAGLTPLEALQAASKNPAEFLGILKFQGTIERNKFADLVLLDGNPLDDIKNSRKIAAVILHGKFLDRASLDALESSAEKYAATQ